MTTPEDAIIRGLLAELVKEEDAVGKAAATLAEATVNFNVASRKYAAVRDMLVAEMGHSPYAKGSKLGQLALDVLKRPIKLGMFRFIHMRVGRAVVAALKEASEPLTLEQIVKTLQDGGIQLPEATLTRATNAALMKTSGIEKTQDDKYRYEEPLAF